MGRYFELFNCPAAFSPFQSWPGYPINSSGYDFRKGQQVRPLAQAIAKPIAPLHEGMQLAEQEGRKNRTKINHR
jgi:hypothetical protein